MIFHRAEVKNESGQIRSFPLDYWSLALDYATRNLRIDTLKTQLDVCRFVCASLAKAAQADHLTPAEKAALAHRWDKALKEGRNLQLAIEILRGQETESRLAAI
jgi:hypothetical protein